jgi:nicotinate-nucleotide--dimethylbenzimidazole phosphoribosyltransferase
MESLFERTLAAIKPSDKEVEKAAWKRLDNLTKPRGSLGRLEELAAQYAAARGSLKAAVEKPCVLVFGADHGVAVQNVSAFPQAVTVQMAANIAAGGAGVSVLARHAGASLRMVDVGIATDAPMPGVVNRKVAKGSADFTLGPAMTQEQCRQALEAGIEEAQDAIAAGSTLLGTGDLGIANTTPSAALYSAYLGIDPEEIVGRGTGIDDARMKSKVEAVRCALAVNAGALNDPFDTLAALGAAAKRVPIVIDGFISGAAAVAALKLKPEAMDYCFFSHASAEGGHKKAMNAIGACPLLGLGLRLGEGTGAALAFNLVQAGNKILLEMASFDEAGVSGSEV